MYAQHTYHYLRTDVVGIELNLLFQNEMILNLIVFHATNTRQSMLFIFRLQKCQINLAFPIELQGGGSPPTFSSLTSVTALHASM